MSDARIPPVRRGRLRVYLGAAPGVGKTFRMLEEGRRRRERGTDVVVAVVESHGRARTAELIEGFEVIPRRRIQHRGAWLDDLDLDAVLARRPEVALVDELAHTNAPGGRHEKRWEDVHALLDAGIDVITTVNVQHLQSLTDALEKITGVQQRETIPDDVVRAADQIELVDISPEALRRRMIHGNVYPLDRVDQALGNYFRIGNLTALRELALLWVADRVDDELARYRAEQGISQPWETRERLVVAMTGAPAAEQLVRRAARMAERSRAELIGVHVRRTDGLREPGGEAKLATHRTLLTELGGQYHEVVGDDPAEQLVAFARAENATQLVLGTSRRRRLEELLRGSVINRAIRRSPDIDVHVISYDHPETPASPRRRRNHRQSPLPRRRRLAAWLVAVLGPVLLTLVFLPFRQDEGLPGVLPAYLLAVVIAALLGGAGPALIASMLGFTAGNAALTHPYGTLRITELASIVGLVSFLAVALMTSLVVGRLGRRTVEAIRAREQAAALSSAAASLADADPVPELLDRLRVLLDLEALAVLGDDGSVLAASGDVDRLAEAERVELSDGRVLATSRAVADAEDRLVLRAFADQLSVALQRAELARDVAHAETLAEIDAFRTALLRSVSHDLRSPLASIKAAVSSLRQDDVDWPAEARAELLATIDEESDRLDRIIGNLLDATRLQAGVLAVQLRPEHVEEVVDHVLRTAFPMSCVRLRTDGPLPPVAADRALLERVVENVVGNAVRYSPGTVEIGAATGDGVVRVSVVDHGPGLPRAARAHMFDAFQRLDDRSAGVGLGLAVADGFMQAMGGTIEATDTPGGGLTMELVLMAAAEEPT